jgi:hypothetical protein
VQRLLGLQVGNDPAIDHVEDAVGSILTVTPQCLQIGGQRTVSRQIRISLFVLANTGQDRSHELFGFS